MTTAIVLLVLFAVILWAFLIGTAKEDQAGETVAEKHEFPNSTRSTPATKHALARWTAVGIVHPQGG